MPDLLTAAQLAALAPDCDAEVWAPALSSAAAEREINTPLRLAHWLGQLCEESAGFVHLTENLSYSAERLCQVWPGRFPTLASAEPFAHNPDALAVRVYSGRMGNVTSDDAGKFIGRGPMMITGRAAYRMYGAALGLPLTKHPELAAQPVPGARIAALYWSDHGLNARADADDIEGITRAINGGLTGLPERKAAVARAKGIFGIRAA
jgi:putative chitinase